MMNTRTFLTLTVLLIAAPATATDFAVMPGTSSASFTSDALLETIRGTTADIGGTISVDLANPTGATGTVTFSATGLRTGNDMRDEHLHSDDWLGSGDITFSIASIATDATELAHGQSASATVSGSLTIARPRTPLCQPL